MRNNKPIIIGAIGATGLLIIYFGILTWVNSFSHALEQFSQMWYWISILVVGFGIQLGLYSYIRFGVTAKTRFWANLPSDLDSPDRAKYTNFDLFAVTPDLVFAKK
ncbi:hypothetical protein HKBW3S03_01475 [Candidatus Hakubella thermalkaliphila]|uniref:Uncharacterized protein n=1 Tax=Candidatus Hakubella thermalkaliphila TaxID=2754717 RepID=A0A6V8NUD7_9ACTN|nr:hypothetical protein [Candidatus Hakubella thermalkaliphila]GFP19971.1 hypothetical protein HKBW3S03_01475 [Candidatus Hakubella thermalkaliphila]GFP23747.1 hypothetical protein HKBW3S09_01212 [Candidatus Hakubella thermalkaliphila]GFP30687.1 hypothetical protein HKBW3S34_01607 [Candidatus Hakubella thermalkaliphila]GFP39312.1 hypothetical protein HKBW3S47_01011 [Candidatus Hakubella thermalkaliphila]